MRWNIHGGASFAFDHFRQSLRINPVPYNMPEMPVFYGTPHREREAGSGEGEGHSIMIVILAGKNQ